MNRRKDALEAEDDRDVGAARVAVLYAEHGLELRRFILGVTGDSDLTNDVLQAAFTKAVEQCESVKAQSLKSWIFRVAFHEALAVRRRKGVEERAHRRLAGFAAARQQGGPDEFAMRREIVEAVRAAMRKLPAEQHRVVRLRVYEDKTFAEIARELDVPLGTVLTRMRLALVKLREYLGFEDR